MPNEAAPVFEIKFAPSDSIKALNSVEASIVKKVEGQTGGAYDPKREAQKWLSELEESTEHRVLFESRSFRGYLTLIHRIEEGLVLERLSRAVGKRKIPADTAFRESEEVAFLARQELTKRFIEGKKDDDPESQRIILTHLALSHYHLSEGLVKRGQQMSFGELNIARALIFSSITNFAAQDHVFGGNCQEVEVVFDEIELLLKMQREKIGAAVLDPVRDSVENFRKSVSGVRAETLAVLVLRRLLDGKQEALKNIFGGKVISNLQILRPSPETISRGQADLFLCGEYGGNLLPLVIIDVRSGWLTKEAGSESRLFDSFVTYNDPEEGVPELKVVGGLGLHKTTSSGTKRLVQETGLPAVSMRVATQILGDERVRRPYPSSRSPRRVNIRALIGGEFPEVIGGERLGLDVDDLFQSVVFALQTSVDRIITSDD